MFVGSATCADLGSVACICLVPSHASLAACVGWLAVNVS
jgi:hypothetical protein